MASMWLLQSHAGRVASQGGGNGREFLLKALSFPLSPALKRLPSLWGPGQMPPTQSSHEDRPLLSKFW